MPVIADCPAGCAAGVLVGVIGRLERYGVGRDGSTLDDREVGRVAGKGLAKVRGRCGGGEGLYA